MRILVINSNTSAAVTEYVAEAAGRFASPGTELVFATGTFGAEIIGTRTENAIAGHSTVDLVARHASECDGVMIAVSYDSGLRAARELSGLPVLSLTESALLSALMLGTRIGLVIWGAGATGLYLELIDSYGLTTRICGTRRVDLPIPANASARERMDEAVIKAGQNLIEESHAEVIMLIGAVFSGRSHDLEKKLPVPVLDGMRCGIPMLEAMIRIGARPPVTGSYALLTERESVGISPELGERLRRLKEIT